MAKREPKLRCGGANASSGRSTVTCSWRSTWTWRRLSTTAHSAEGLRWRSREWRRRCRTWTPPNGDCRHLLQGRGQDSLRNLGQSGVTAPCGTPRERACRPSPCRRRPRLWTSAPSLFSWAVLWRSRERRRRRGRKRGRRRRRVQGQGAEVRGGDACARRQGQRSH